MSQHDTLTPAHRAAIARYLKASPVLSLSGFSRDELVAALSATQPAQAQQAGEVVSNDRDCPYCNYTGSMHCGDVAEKYGATGEHRDCSHAKLFGLRTPPAPAQAVQGEPVQGVPEFVSLSARIRELITEHGTLRAVSRSLGIDVGYLSRLEHGDKVSPSPEVLAKLGMRDAGTLYERLTSSPTPPAQAQQSGPTVQQMRDMLAAQKLAVVPMRETSAMRDIFEEEGWEWAELLSYAEAITEDEYAWINQAGVAPAQPVQWVPETHPLMIFARECEVGAYQEHEIPLAARKAINAAKKYLLTAAPTPPAQQPEAVPSGLHETDIYDFAGWLTSRPGVMEVGCTSWACPMADAVVEYIKTFPERFAPAQQPADDVVRDKNVHNS